MREKNYLTFSAVKINGTYIEDVIVGYHTLSNSGRDALIKEYVSERNQGSDGELKRRSSFPAREIKVEYLIEADSHDEFHEKYEKLATMLNVEDAQIIFNDEADKYYIGSIYFGEEPQEGQHWRSGEYVIKCYDPFKYAVNETGPVITQVAYDTTDVELYSASKIYNVGSMVKYNNKLYVCNTNGTTGTWNASKWNEEIGAAFIVNNDGGHTAYPRFEVEFADDTSGGNVGTGANCGFVQFAKDETRLQFGDDEEELIVPASGFNSDFTSGTMASMSQAANGFTLQEFVDDANATVGAEGIAPGYGTTATGWHGSLLTKTISAQTDFIFDWQQLIAVTNKKQAFGFIAAVLDSSNKIIAGVKYTKSGTSNTKGTISYIVEDAVIATKSVDFKKAGVFGYNTTTPKATRNSIERNDNIITFKLASDSTAVNGYPTAQPVASKIVFGFVKSAAKTVAEKNNLLAAGFSAKNEQNTFTSNDKLEVITASAKVMLNNSESADLGDIGNEWSDFTLDVGRNVIFTAFSSWCAMPPVFKLYYRKRWL